jgi:hypothetical protein
MKLYKLFFIFEIKMKRTNKRTSRFRNKLTKRKSRKTKTVRLRNQNSPTRMRLASAYEPGSEKPYRVGTRLIRPRLTRKRGYTKWQVETQSIGIGPLKKNKLTKYGYHFDINKKDRAVALSKAIKEYGALSVYRSLNAIAVYNKNTHPEMAKVSKEDRDMIREKFF